MSRKRKPNRQHPLNKAQQPSYVNQELLKAAQDTKEWAKKLKVEKSLLNRIDAIEQRLKNVGAVQSSTKNYGKAEQKELLAIIEDLEARTEAHRRRQTRRLMLLFLVKVFIYFHFYLQNIPQKQFAAYQPFYIISGLIIWLILYGYLYLLLRSYTYLYFRYIDHHLRKLPKFNQYLFILLYAVIFETGSTETFFSIARIVPDYLSPSFAAFFTNLFSQINTLLHSDLIFDLVTLFNIIMFFPFAYTYLKKFIHR